MTRAAKRWRGWVRGALMSLCPLLFTACGQNMAEQPKYQPMEASALFPDGGSARPPPPGTVARDAAIEPVPATSPLPLTEAVLKRGRERHDIYCAPCHGRLGDGMGRVTERGYPHPSSYHTERLRKAPERHFYDVMADGSGRMLPSGGAVPPDDRWAIAAYIRVLQLSQNASLRDAREAGVADRLGERP